MDLIPINGKYLLSKMKGRSKTYLLRERQTKMSQNIAYYFDVNVSMPMTKDASLYYHPVLEKTLNELVIQNV